MNEKMIRDAYCKIRAIDNTIPDDVLDFMLEAALQKLSNMKDAQRGITIIEGESVRGRDCSVLLGRWRPNLEAVVISPDKVASAEEVVKSSTLEQLSRPKPYILTKLKNNQMDNSSFGMSVWRRATEYAPSIENLLLKQSKGEKLTVAEKSRVKEYEKMTRAKRKK